MIKFFRKIRQRTLTENKFGKYLTYAMGEIVLVVIGILIALQINSLNEENKKEKLKDNYIKAFQTDLKADVNLLEGQIANFNEELKKNVALAKRLSAPFANSDTIIKIARYKFTPFFNPSNELNLNTLE